MQTSPPDFVDSFRRHLIREQRKAVLEVLASELDPDITIGEVIDAAEDLGWTEGIGDLCLADLAEALVEDQAGRAVEAVSAAAQAVSRDHEDETEDDEDEAVDEDEEDEEDEEVAAPPIPKAKMASKKVAKAKKAAKAAPTKKAAKAPVKSAKKAAAAIPAAKKASKKAAKAPAKPAKKAPVVDDLGEDAMSMEQAAKALLPLIRKLKEATMQDLEEKTGMGRRKLRFHIGQLVKHGRLNRHGMGRGTYYTVAR